MYCPLVDAFPIREKKNLISCWQADKETEKVPERKGALVRQESPCVSQPTQSQVTHMSQSNLLGQSSLVGQSTPFGQVTISLSPCVMNLHHCLSCPYCKDFLLTFFEMENGEKWKRKSRRHNYKRGRSSSDSGRERQGRQGVGASVDLDETIMRIDVTWTTLLVILAGSTFFLLLWRVLGERK